MHRLLILEPEHSGGRRDRSNRGKEGWKNRRYKEEGRKKGRGSGEQQGVTSVGVERETRLERGGGGRESESKARAMERDRERVSANQAASLSPGLITVRRLRLFIIRPRQTRQPVTLEFITQAEPAACSHRSEEERRAKPDSGWLFYLKLQTSPCF